MSHSARTVSSHTLLPSKAIDRPPILMWEVYVGEFSGFLFITGPGSKAMLRVSRVPSPEYRKIARRAVSHLNLKYRDDMDAGNDVILETLKKFGWEEEL